MKDKIKKIIRNRINNQTGFTLVEMMIVLIIVGLLMAIIIPNVAGQKNRIEVQARENIAEIVETQVNTYSLVENQESVTLEELVLEGYLTQKQADEASRLLNIDPKIVISTPIMIDDGQ